MSESQQRELLSLSNEQLTELLESFAQAPYRLRQLLDGLYRQRWSRLEQFSTLPRAFRQQLVEANYQIGHPAIEKRFTSSDGTVRYLFAFSDGQSVETVWMPEGDGGEAGDGSDSGDEELAETSLRGVILSEATKGSGVEGPLPSEVRSGRTRATICVSSQIGCAVECAFCMTALLGLHRNLTAGEIVGQVLAVLNDQQVEIDRDRINLVFMGQGEPFLNYDNFMQAVRMLVTEAGIPASRMTVSTSGIVPRIADFGAEEVRPKLAVSLNASNEALRTEVMPITKKWTIAKLLAALRDFPLRNRERLTFEYVLLGGFNDDPSHAHELVDLIRGLRAKVNLIALNPGPEIPFTMPDTASVQAFQSILVAAGIPAFIRRPRGRDIYAACGQLKHTTELVKLS
ncbi:MAG: 23S rRNA (adenine(2503)-C(2))-methyltransferase RlmN [Candidatus Korobacteraceae bacterium]